MQFMTTHNLLFMKPLRSITFLVALFLLTVSDVSAQEVMRVLGTVVVKSDGSPCIGVNVSDASTRRVLAMTDVDGSAFQRNRRQAERTRHPPPWQPGSPGCGSPCPATRYTRHSVFSAACWPVRRCSSFPSASLSSICMY